MNFARGWVGLGWWMCNTDDGGYVKTQGACELRRGEAGVNNEILMKWPRLRVMGGLVRSESRYTLCRRQP